LELTHVLAAESSGIPPGDEHQGGDSGPDGAEGWIVLGFERREIFRCLSRPPFFRPSEPVGFSSLNLLGDRNVNLASVRLALRKAVDRLQGTWKTPAAAGAV
jgi:hypothetical protein